VPVYPGDKFEPRLPAGETILSRDFSTGRGGAMGVGQYLSAHFRRLVIERTVVLDLFGRKVIGWALNGGMESENTTVAVLEMVVKNRAPQEGLPFHSDRGVQYCA
jgi:transposase InsO family protein